MKRAGGRRKCPAYGNQRRTVFLQYGFPDLYQNVDGNIIRSDTQELMQDLLMEYMGTDMSSMMTMQEQSPFGTSSVMQSQYLLWKELIPGDNGKLINPVIEEQYDLIYGNWPTRYDEVVLLWMKTTNWMI